MYRFYLFHPDLKTKQRIADPVGWDTLGKTIKRDSKWLGVFWEYTPKMKFVKDGRQIVQNFFERYGIEANLVLTVYKKNNVTRQFDFYYEGRLNMLTYHITKLYAECNIEQTGFLQKMKNRADVKINLQSLVNQDGGSIAPFTNETESVSLHSKVIKKEFDGNSLTETIEAEYASTAAMIADQGSQVSGLKYHAPQDDVDGVPILRVFTYLGTTNGDLTDYTSYPSSMSSGRYEPIEFQQNYITFALQPTKNEINQYVAYSTAISALEPTANAKYQWKVEDAGSYQFNIVVNGRLYTPFHTFIGEFYQELTFRLKYGKPGHYTEEIIGVFDTDGSAPQVITAVDTLAITLDLEANDEVYIYGEYFNTIKFAVPGQAAYIFFAYNAGFVCSVTITALTTFAPTPADVVMMHEAWARVLQSITSTKDPLRSPLYGRTDSSPVTYAEDGEGSLRAFCGGSNVRGFPLVDRPIHTSFNELFNICSGIDGIGLGVVRDGITERIVVDKLSAFFNNKRSIQLPFVRDISKTIVPDFYFIGIDGGYEKALNEQLNNLDEFNAKREYVIPLSQVKNRLDLRVDYITSGYTTEFVRRDHYTPDNNKDNDRDNDNFLFQLRRNMSAFDIDKDEDFAELNNVLSPETIYNAKLSPMRNIIRNGSRIRTALYHLEDKAVMLTPPGEGNTNFTSRLTTESELVSETSIVASKLTKPLFYAELYAFSTKINREQMEIIEDNPYDYIEFAEDDKSWKRGFLWTIEPEGKSDLTRIELLRANF